MSVAAEFNKGVMNDEMLIVNGSWEIHSVLAEQCHRNVMRETNRWCRYNSDAKTLNSWWRHQMETLSALLALCAVTGEFPTPRPVARSLDVFFDLCLNKRLSKQSLGWWFETPSRSLWRNCIVELCLCSLLFVKRTRTILHYIPVNPSASIFPPESYIILNPPAPTW